MGGFPEHSCVGRGWSGDMREELFPSSSPPPSPGIWHSPVSCPPEFVSQEFALICCQFHSLASMVQRIRVPRELPS